MLYELNEQELGVLKEALDSHCRQHGAKVAGLVAHMVQKLSKPIQPAKPTVVEKEPQGEEVD